MDNIPEDSFPDNADGYGYPIEVTSHKNFDSNLAKSFSEHSHRVKFSKNTHTALVGAWNKAQAEGLTPEETIKQFEPLIEKHGISHFQMQESHKWLAGIQDKGNREVAKIQDTARQTHGTFSGKATRGRATAIKSLMDDPAYINANDPRHAKVMKKLNKLYAPTKEKT